MDVQQLAAELEALRVAQGLTQGEVGERAGVTRQAVANIVKGKRYVKSLESLAAVFEAVGAKLVVQVIPADAGLVSVTAKQSLVGLLDELAKLSEDDLEMVRRYAHLLPRVDRGVHYSFRSELGVWEEVLEMKTPQVPLKQQ